MQLMSNATLRLRELFIQAYLPTEKELVIMPEEKEVKWPGQVNEAHPEIFNTLPSPIVAGTKPGQLTEEQVKQYFTEGYVLLDEFFKRDELEPVKDSIKDLVEELAVKLHDAGKIKKLYRECGLFQRLTQLEKEFPGANIILHKLGKLPQAFRDLWSNERLLNIAEQLIGPDIVGHPVWNLRTKTPKNEATTVPWHQDSAYLDNNSYKVLQVTAWIPLLNATEENGCMQLAKKGHKTGKVATHQCCHGNTWYVMLEEDEMERSLDVNVQEDIITCPVPYGGVLLFNNMVPHRSLNNLSKEIRWSLDLRWQQADKNVGFYGLKDGVRMRSSADPSMKIDWEAFDAVNRHHKACESLEMEERKDEFDTTIPGPWMKKWEIVHMNIHTDKQAEEDAAAAESGSAPEWRP